MTLSRIMLTVGAVLAILFAAYAWNYSCYYWFVMTADQDPALIPPSIGMLGFLTLAAIGGVAALWKDRPLPLVIGLAGYLIYVLILSLPLFAPSNHQTQGFSSSQLLVFLVFDPQFVVPLAGLLLALPRLARTMRSDGFQSG
jgi:hypothetical protein